MSVASLEDRSPFTQDNDRWSRCCYRERRGRGRVRGQGCRPPRVLTCLDSEATGRGGGGDRRLRPAGRWRSPASWVRTRCASTAGLRRPDEGSTSSGHIYVTTSLLRGASGHGVCEGGGWLPTPRKWSQRLPRVNTAAAQLLPPAPGPFCHSARSHPPPPPRAQRLSSRPRRRTRAAAGLRAGPRLARPPAPRFRACPVLREMTSAASPQTRVAGEGRVPMPAPAPTGSQILCSVDVRVQP